MATLPIFSEAAADAVQQLFLGGVAISAPATWGIGLWRGDLATGTEVPTSGTGYARRTFDNDATVWQSVSAGSGVKMNAAELRFPASGEGTGDWGSISGLAFFLPGGTVPYFLLRFEVATTVQDSHVSVPAGGVKIILRSTGVIANEAFYWMKANGLATKAFERLFDLLLGGTAWSPPTAWDAALYFGHPGDSGTELSGVSNYARVSYAQSTWTDGSWQWRTNSDALTFPETGSADAWGQPTHLVFFAPGTNDPYVVWEADIPYVDGTEVDGVTFGAGSLLWRWNR